MPCKHPPPPHPLTHTGCPKKNATSYIFLDYRENRKPVFIIYTLLESYISQLSTMKKSQWSDIPVGRYPPKHDTPSEVKSRATGTGLLIHKLAMRYIFPNCWKTMRPVCIVLTSLESYTCQLTNIEKLKSNNTPEGRYSPKGHNPSMKWNCTQEVLVCLHVIFPYRWLEHP